MKSVFYTKLNLSLLIFFFEIMISSCTSPDQEFSGTFANNSTNSQGQIYIPGDNTTSYLYSTTTSAREPDSDQDGCPDNSDPYPDDPTRCSSTDTLSPTSTAFPSSSATTHPTNNPPDFDKDGVPDVMDGDADNDTLNSTDDCNDLNPDPKASKDTDSDKICDDNDNDNDNDKIPDNEDCSPGDPDRLKSHDTDKDGLCDDTNPVFVYNSWVSIPKNGEENLISFNVQNSVAIQLTPYRILQNEVSAQDYNKCVNAGKCTGIASVIDAATPVINITWQQATDYCKWIGGNLPTEAQWEYAATAGVPFSPNCAIGAYKENSFETLALVNTNPNGNLPFSLNNMGGNVFEWTRDSFSNDFFNCVLSSACERGIQINKLNPWNDSGATNWKIVRGFGHGSYCSQAINLGIFTYRNYTIDKNTMACSNCTNDYAYMANFGPYLGMRCVME